MTIAQRFSVGLGQVHRTRPEGTVETRLFIRPFGTNWCLREVPTLKRWAIVAHPSGMKAREAW
jgi:hypothetical protein